MRTCCFTGARRWSRLLPACWCCQGQCLAGPVQTCQICWPEGAARAELAIRRYECCSEGHDHHEQGMHMMPGLPAMQAADRAAVTLEKASKQNAEQPCWLHMQQQAEVCVQDCVSHIQGGTTLGGLGKPLNKPAAQPSRKHRQRSTQLLHFFCLKRHFHQPAATHRRRRLLREDQGEPHGQVVEPEC